VDKKQARSQNPPRAVQADSAKVDFAALKRERVRVILKKEFQDFSLTFYKKKYKNLTEFVSVMTKETVTPGLHRGSHSLTGDAVVNAFDV
jgi:hypothetical protein